MKSVKAVVAVVWLISGIATAQQKPNFSGTWIPEGGKDSEAETIRHDGNTFTRSHGSEGGGHTFVIKLDGTESRNLLHGGDVVILAKATWTGDHLVITSDTTYANGRRLKERETWWLDREGRLHFEFEQAMDGKKPTKGKLVYMKRSQTPRSSTPAPTVRRY